MCLREPNVVPNVYKHFLHVIAYYGRKCRQGFIGKATSAKRERPYDITYMWNLKYDTHGLIYETEIGSQTQRTDL